MCGTFSSTFTALLSEAILLGVTLVDFYLGGPLFYHVNPARFLISHAEPTLA